MAIQCRSFGTIKLQLCLWFIFVFFLFFFYLHLKDAILQVSVSAGSATPAATVVNS